MEPQNDKELKLEAIGRNLLSNIVLERRKGNEGGKTDECF
jgi:hypothetical protein